MRQSGVKYCVAFLLIAACGLFFSGCAGGELTKTIVLEEKSGQSEEMGGYAVKNIKEYFYEEENKEESTLALEAGMQNFSILKHTKAGYEYQEIDIGREKIILDAMLQPEDIVQAKISSTGEYIAYTERCGKDGWMELMVFSVKDGQTFLITEAYEIPFTWSGDGKKLFYANKQEEVLLCYWEEGNFISFAEPRKASDSTDIILPNTDGSQICILSKEKEGVFTGYFYMVEDEGTEVQKSFKLPQKGIEPLKYTDAGLFALDEANTLYLITGLRGELEMEKVAELESRQLIICEQGDHVFELKRDEDAGYYEIRSLYLNQGTVAADKLLYKEAYGNFEEAAVAADDTAILLKSCEQLGKRKYSYKITMLEYGDKE